MSLLVFCVITTELFLSFLSEDVDNILNQDPTTIEIH
jgi:hypothetical protein